MSDLVRIGFIGTGRYGREHVRWLMDRPDVEIVSFADPSEESREAALELLGREIATYSDYKEMIRQEELDGVVISTPHTLHHEQVMTCLDHGLHVLIEKPMTCNTTEALDIVRKQQETGKVVLVGFQRHFSANYRWVRQQIEQGAIGRVTLIQGFISQNWLRIQYTRKVSWRLDPSLSGGGQISDSGSHLIDALLWVTGLEPEEVTAYIDNRGERVDINSAVNIRFKGGAIGSLAVVGDQVADGMWEDATIVGDKGIIWLRRDGTVYFASEENMTPTQVTEFVVPNDPCPGRETIEEAAVAKDEHFIDLIRGTAENQVPPASTLTGIRLTEAIWRSAEAGQPVAVEPSN